MNIFYGTSKSGNISEAIKGLRNPVLIMLFSTKEKLEADTAFLEDAFPGVPSIGCVAMGYRKNVTENGVTVAAFIDGISVKTGVLRKVSVAPAMDIVKMQENISALRPGKDNTIIIDFCSGNDACVLSTIEPLLKRFSLELMGGTGDAGKVSCNGKVYEDGCAYAVIKSMSGRIKAFKEDIYAPMPGIRLIASKTDRSRYYVGQFNGKSAKKAYMDILDIPESKVTSQTFKNPFGKIVGDSINTISIKEIQGEGLITFRQINDSDILTIQQLQDIDEVIGRTISNITKDFRHISAVFSVNCLFRYLLFNDEKYWDRYLDKMSALGTHFGFVGYGEHYNNRFVNQTMSCMVFE